MIPFLVLCSRFQVPEHFQMIHLFRLHQGVIYILYHVINSRHVFFHLLPPHPQQAGFCHVAQAGRDQTMLLVTFLFLLLLLLIFSFSVSSFFFFCLIFFKYLDNIPMPVLALSLLLRHVLYL